MDAIKGVEELNRQLAEISKVVENNDYLVAAGYVLLRESMKNAPVKTGFLRQSGYVKDIDKNLVEVGFSANYALPVHEGHHSWEGNPFMSRAIFEHVDDMVNAAKDQLESDIKRVL